LLTVVGLAAGCASTGAKRADKLNSSVAATRIGLEDAKQLGAETLGTLDSLQLESTVLADAYPKFQKDVKGVADAVEATGATATCIFVPAPFVQDAVIEAAASLLAALATPVP